MRESVKEAEGQYQRYLGTGNPEALAQSEVLWREILSDPNFA